MHHIIGLPRNSVIKNLLANTADASSIPGLGTCSSILPWEIPWTEEPGGLQSMGLQKSWK